MSRTVAFPGPGTGRWFLPGLGSLPPLGPLLFQVATLLLIDGLTHSFNVLSTCYVPGTILASETQQRVKETNRVRAGWRAAADESAVSAVEQPQLGSRAAVSVRGPGWAVPREGDTRAET